MTKKQSIFDFWCADFPMRENQKVALQWLEDNSDKKYLFLEAPVGSGKSLISITYQYFLGGGAYIMTPQKILQTQYEKDENKIRFRPKGGPAIGSYYGKGNYDCRKGTKCDVGSEFGMTCKNCPYKAAKSRAMQAPNTVMNYSLGLLTFAYSPNETKKKLVVLDECHNLEENLTEFNSVSISEARVKKFGLPYIRFKSEPQQLEWFYNTYAPIVKGKMEELQAKIKVKYPGIFNKDLDRPLSKDEESMARNYQALKRHNEEVQELASMDPELLIGLYVIVDQPQSFKFKRLKGDRAFKDVLHNYGEKFLFMSSTILDYKEMCKDLGVDESQAAFLSLGSEFPVENRKVYYSPCAKMNKDWMTDNRSKAALLTKTLDILKSHQGEKGIIHSGNFSIASWLVEELEDNDTHTIFHHNPVAKGYARLSRDNVIGDFQAYNKGPAILISPSITEGLDLKDDLARFAIFAKVPYPSLGDQWVKRRMELSQRWYTRQALLNIIQGGGRVVRSESDFGTVYILDSTFIKLLQMSKFMIPEWWGESLEKIL